jgi:predicted unusual protein kinase regulating ubiquinone biosynthesis (AarF/ABC1/UbiB family)
MMKPQFLKKCTFSTLKSRSFRAGMMGEIAKDTKTRLLEVFYAVYEKDARKVMAELVALGALVPTGDQTSVSQLEKV